jgi:hypothetical protein
MTEPNDLFAASNALKGTRTLTAKQIEAIRQEARAAVLREVAEKVRGLMPTYQHTGAQIRAGVLREVLALLDAEPAE